jgi:uncharacterized protein
LSQAEIRNVLNKCKTIAVIGLSNEKTKPSYRVAAYMQKNGYRIIPINPTVKEVLGEKSYPSLLQLPEDTKRIIDIIDIFRRPQYVNAIVEEAIKLKKQFGRPLVIWMQLGVINTLAAKKAVRAGLIVVMGKCLMIEHRLLD